MLPTVIALLGDGAYVVIFDLIKLGGSVLTDKRTPYRLREDVLRRLAREILEGVPEERWQSGAGIVIVHGAGSFGHPRASSSALPVLGRATSSSAPLPSLRQSVVTVQAEVRRLHLMLLETLVEVGIPAVSLPGAGFLRMQNGRLERPDLTEFLRATSQGLVPLTCGDVILDAVKGPHVISGDRVMVEICRQSEPERVTFVTDVDGVYDRDPESPEAILIDRLDLSTGWIRTPGEPEPGVDRALEARRPRSERHGDERCADERRGDERRRDEPRADVTGGMEGKLEEIQRIADAQRDTVILSGLEPGRLEARLRGDAVLGTSISAS
ncbi:MAG: isopentenyl phosphate kinase [Candidatus Eisenbacteria bacterium]